MNTAELRMVTTQLVRALARRGIQIRRKDALQLVSSWIAAGADATVRQPARWGEYEAAIRRWESLTRPAPEPTKLNAKGNPKLSDEFDEWLMGLPEGWLTEVPNITWNEVLKACGNGVLWQQAAVAVRHLLSRLWTEEKS